MAALEEQRCSDQWQREGGRYIPNPLTWLNQGRWDDELPENSGKFDAMNELKKIIAEESGGTFAALRRMYEAEGGDDA